VKAKGLTFDDVAKAGLTLPNTEEATAWGGRCLKVNGRHFTGMAINKSAEPNSLIIHIDTAQRDGLSRLHPGALEDLLRMSHRFMSARNPKRARTKRPPRSRRNPKAPRS
jgi:hypothetical protein